MKTITKLLFSGILFLGLIISGAQTVNAQCQASFTYVDNGGGNFSFTNTSTGGPTFYSIYWTFGDGNNAWTTNAQHTYSNNGTYVVCLTINDSINQCQSTFCDSILVTGVITCNLNIPYYTVDSICNYYFTANNTGANYFWDFGDGNFSNQQNLVHSYTNNGWYYYCLTVDSCPSICDSIYVGCNVAAPCSTVASFNVIDNGGGNYTFNNTSTGSNLTYYWNFGDGNTSFATNPSHTYTANGAYAVALYVFDTLDSNCYDYTVQTINVTNVSNPVACQAGFTVYPDSANPGNVIVVNNSTGNNLSYYWSFGDGNFSYQQFPSYTYNSNGPFELCLTVFDSISQCQSTYCDSIFSGGSVLKQSGFTINVVSPTSTGFEEDIELINDLSAYPNPVKNNLTIDINLTSQTQVEVTIVDLLGNQIASVSNEMLNAGQNTLKWNTSNIANGVYLLNVKTENTLKVKKFIVNK